MSAIRRAVEVLRESAATARSQPVASILTIVMVAGMVSAALLTTGRTVAAEQAALAQIDAAGTRTIVVRSDPAAGVTAAILDRLRALEAVEAVAGFGPVVDARNAAVPGAAKVATRRGYGVIGDHLLMAFPTIGIGILQGRGLASEQAQRELGLPDAVGDLSTDDGRGIAIVGSLAVPSHLAFLEPLVVVPCSAADRLAGDSPGDPLAVLVVLTRSPDQVAVVETALRGLLAGADPTMVAIETSAELAAIRAAVRGELGSYGRSLVLGILGLAAGLVAVNNLAVVTLRRRDFGRRRALGATRSLIIGLLLGQVAMLALVGAVVGVAAALISLGGSGHQVPDVGFVTAVAIASVLTPLVAAFLPAVIASRRDPLHELRVP